jgi:multiple sugar transport system substrate-binding protein
MEASSKQQPQRGSDCRGESNDVSWMVNQFPLRFGGSLVNQTDGGCDQHPHRPLRWNSTGTFWENTRNRPGRTTPARSAECIRNQEVAFEILGIWGITDIQKNGSLFEVGVIPLKQIGVCSEIGPMMLALPANMSDEGKQQGIAFIRYMISMDAQQAILNGEYSPEHDTYYPFRKPIRIDMADTPVMRMHPEYQLFIEGFQNPSVDVPVPAWQTIKEDYYEAGLHRVMTGETSIEAFLSLIETEGNRILSER